MAATEDLAMGELQQRFDAAWADVTSRAIVVVQDPPELFALIALMNARGVRRYLELGASEGVSLYTIGMCLPEGAEIDAVDLGEAHSVGNLRDNVRRLNASGRRTTLFEMTTLDARQRLHGKTYDAILIDAGHKYEEVKNDWEMYRGMAPMIVFHDIRLGGPSQLWWELGGGLEIHCDRTRPMGFGVKIRA
jgi:predicted O-methyltransferase YrrM